MLSKRLHLLLWCMAVAILAFIVLDFWNTRNAPLYKKFESQWRQDISLLISSKKLPPPWFDVREVELIGGTPETRGWLPRINSPVIATKPDGKHRLEILIVVWEEQGTHGALIQYNLVNLQSKNMVWELGRTLILSAPN